MTGKKQKIIRWLYQSSEKAMDFLLPPLCLRCEKMVLRNQSLCADCWKQIHFIEKPFCACCGLPFDVDVGEGGLCGACHAEPPAFDGARSAFVYDEASRSIILRLKHADQLHALPAMGAWLARAGSDFWGQIDLLMPVPLHRWRLLKRRYNQSALLAKAVGKTVGLPVCVDGLIRHRPTPSQGHLGRKERQENVAGAFSANPRKDFQGKKIVLLDDVLTSGATVGECARCLKKAGAQAIYVVTLARVRGLS